jgi:predicted RNA-binding protein with TRAM domain
VERYDEDERDENKYFKDEFDRRNKPPTVKLGDELKIIVDGVGKNGDPYGKHNGFVIFIKGVGAPIPMGTSKVVKVTKVNKACALAQLVGGGNDA